MFNRIPEELKQLNQWLVWRIEIVNDKKTKVPYNPHNGKLASVIDPATWGTFKEALKCLQTAGIYSGIGLVETKNDPYTCIDLDDTHGDLEAQERQVKVYKEFDSYTERSWSGKGAHVWIKGAIPKGRRKLFIEVYSSERFMAMTGDVVNDKPIEERQDKLNILWEGMQPANENVVCVESGPETQTDEQIIEIASNAANSDVFNPLLAGDFSAYPSQSEADFAFINIIAYYTDNEAQIIRIFKASKLGQRKKAQRKDYVSKMVKESFDRKLPKIDPSGLRRQYDEVMNKILQKSRVAPANICTYKDNETDPYFFPPGLLGDIARFIFEAAPRPVKKIALTAAIGLMSGICGRCYNVSNTGLNQYVLFLGTTGIGKEAIASGIGILIGEVEKQVESAINFIGPGEIASHQALIKHLSESPTHSFVSILGEFGLLLSRLYPKHSNGTMDGLRAIILSLYNKSGKGNIVLSSIRSDKTNNVPSIKAPAFSIIGESTPEEFFKVADIGLIAQGLIPRFSIFEYIGERPTYNRNHAFVRPNESLIRDLVQLCSRCAELNKDDLVDTIPLTLEAEDMAYEFMNFCEVKMKNGSREALNRLWNRGHLNVLKLAALDAVGLNWIKPVIGVSSMKWAIGIVKGNSTQLIENFESGANKNVEDGANDAIKLIRNAIRKFAMSDVKAILEKRGQREANLHHEHIVPHRYLQQRLSRAIKNVDLLHGIKSLVTSGELIEVDNKKRKELQDKYSINSFKAGLYWIDPSFFDIN